MFESALRLDQRGGVAVVVVELIACRQFQSGVVDQTVYYALPGGLLA